MTEKFSSDAMDKSKQAIAGKLPAPSPTKQTLRPRPAAAKRSVAASMNSKQPASSQVPVVKDELGCDVALKLAFLGAGQGGGRMTAAFHDLGYRRTAVFNTTSMDFAGIPDSMPRLSLDVGGAAKDTSQAARALKGREEEVRDLLSQAWGKDIDHGMLTVGLGGGTGGGTAGELIRIARQYLKDNCGHSNVGAIVSLPPTAEGYQVARNAVNCFQELISLDISPLIVVDNTRIQEVYGPSISRLHSTANDIVSQLLHTFNELSAVKSQMITFDEAELRQLFDSGLVVMGAAVIADAAGEITTPTQISSTIREQLNAAVLAETDLSTGDKGVCLFVGDQETMDSLSMEYFDAGFEQMDRLLASNGNDKKGSVLHRGVYLGANAGLEVYTMMGGLDLPRETLTKLADKGGLTNETTSAACRTTEWLSS